MKSSYLCQKKKNLDLQFAHNVNIFVKVSLLYIIQLHIKI